VWGGRFGRFPKTLLEENEEEKKGPRGCEWEGCREAQSLGAGCLGVGCGGEKRMQEGGGDDMGC